MNILCLINIFILVPPNASFQFCTIFSLLKHYALINSGTVLTLGLSSYIVGETWKCNTKKRCVLTSLMIYVFLQVLLTVTHSSLWPTLKSRSYLSGTEVLFCILHPLVVTVLVNLVLICTCVHHENKPCIVS